MHEKPDGQGDIESTFDDTGVHNYNVRERSWQDKKGSLVTKMDLRKKRRGQDILRTVERRSKQLVTKTKEDLQVVTVQLR